MATIDQLFTKMLEQDASDLHMSVGMPPIFRINGDLVQINSKPLTTEQNKRLFDEILSKKAKQDLEERLQADFVYELPGKARFRSNVFIQHRGLCGAFRQIPSKILTAKDLNLPPSVLNMTRYKRGMILVTGPTGSGKSTTLAAMLDMINESRKEHILTVEDPIEFVHQPKKCLISQREVGQHVNSFADALRAALREDPDVILVGEMRDLETISLALTAAETGHLVLGTLHTTGAAKTVDRIIDAFPADSQQQVRVMLSESLRGVVSQALIKRIDRPGRIAALEVLISTGALANIIREGKTPQISSLMQTGRAQGMQLMDQSLLDLVKQKVISLQDARDLSISKGVFDQMLKGGSPEEPDLQATRIMTRPQPTATGGSMKG